MCLHEWKREHCPDIHPDSHQIPSSDLHLHSLFVSTAGLNLPRCSLYPPLDVHQGFLGKLPLYHCPSGRQPVQLERILQELLRLNLPQKIIQVERGEPLARCLWQAGP